MNTADKILKKHESYDHKNTTDYKQLAYKLQSDIDTLKWEAANINLPFYKEMQHYALKAFEERDVVAREMLLKMIEDLITECDEILQK